MIYRYNNYKNYVNDIVKKNGIKGVWSKMAEYIGVQAVVVSQIFKGERDLNEEQAFMVADFIQLDSAEKDYFLLLVKENKTSHHFYKTYLSQKLKQLKKDFLKPSTHINQMNELPPEVYSLYYSNWKYSIVRLLCSISKDRDQIVTNAKTIGINALETKEILKQLISWGIIEIKNDKYHFTKQRIHLDDQRELLNTHLTNWRLQSIDRIQKNRNHYDPLFYSSVFTIDKESSIYIKEELNKLIRNVSKKVKTAKSKQIHSLNLDFFRML